MRFVVTGTPRSATRYSAQLFEALGVPCSHEQTLRPTTSGVDVLNWWSAGDKGESSWMALMLLPVMQGPVAVFHTVRDPWKVIDSLANRNAILKADQAPGSAMWTIRTMIDAYLPGVMQRESRIDRAASFVLGWNQLIADRVPERFVYNADRLDVETVRQMLGHIAIERTDDEISEALNEVSTNTNAGYTVVKSEGVSDPLVAKWIEQYAKEQGCSGVFTRRIKNTPDRQTPEQLAEQMDPDLLEQVNQYAVQHGYQAVEQLVAA